MLKRTLISIPESAENQDFVNKLVDAFKQNSDGSREIYIDAKSQRKNEITVINLTSCFSLRMVNDVKILKQKYDLQLKGSNPEVARLVLHLEGDGSQYPSVYTETQAERKLRMEKMVTDALPYVLLSYTLGLIQYQDRMDGTGKKAYCIIKEDEFGFPMPPVVLGEKITQVIDSPLVDEELCNELKAKVEMQMEGDYLHVSKRGELEAILKKELSGTVLPECKNNPSDPVFVKFREAATEALKILKK